MAWHNIEYACGHTVRTELTGTVSKRESYIEWCREGRVCPDCKRAEKRAQFKESMKEEKRQGLLMVPYIRPVGEAALRVEIEANMRGVVHEWGPDYWLVFGGDTYPHKDDLKALGCRWTADYGSYLAIDPAFGGRDRCKRWCLPIAFDDDSQPEARVEALCEALNKGCALGAKVPDDGTRFLEETLREMSCLWDVAPKPVQPWLSSIDGQENKQQN